MSDKFNWRNWRMEEEQKIKIIQDKALLKQIKSFYKLKEEIRTLTSIEENLKSEILKSVEVGQHEIGDFRISKIFYDSCIVPSFTRASYYALTVSKI